MSELSSRPRTTIASDSSRVSKTLTNFSLGSPFCSAMGTSNSILLRRLEFHLTPEERCGVNTSGGFFFFAVARLGGVWATLTKGQPRKVKEAGARLKGPADKLFGEPQVAADPALLFLFFCRGHFAPQDSPDSFVARAFIHSGTRRQRVT